MKFSLIYVRLSHPQSTMRSKAHYSSPCCCFFPESSKSHVPKEEGAIQSIHQPQQWAAASVIPTTEIGIEF